MIIESKDNKLIKYAKQIQIKKYSSQFGECFLETEKVVFDCLDKNMDITHIFILNSSYEKYKNKLEKYSSKVYQITEKVADNLSQTASGADIFACAKIPNRNVDLKYNTVVLEGLQDPANIGAIIRSALAFNFRNIIAINSVYPYVNKTIRSSMTYIFDCNYKEMTFDEFKDFKLKNEINVVVADMNGEDISKINEFPKNLALVIGNEGQGISDKMMDLADKVVSINMENGVESLNASVSASIIMNKIKEKNYVRS